MLKSLILRLNLFLLLATLPVSLVAAKVWKEGHLLSVEIKDFETGKHRLDHRYLCTIVDGDMRYIVEYEKPLKVAVNDPVQFIVDKDILIVRDADHKERSAKIEKRERGGQ
jgi:hypothetical protein